jgi:hypothetical protein
LRSSHALLLISATFHGNLKGASDPFNCLEHDLFCNLIHTTGSPTFGIARLMQGRSFCRPSHAVNACRNQITVCTRHLASITQSYSQRLRSPWSTAPTGFERTRRLRLTIIQLKQHVPVPQVLPVAGRCCRVVKHSRRNYPEHSRICISVNPPESTASHRVCVECFGRSISLLHSVLHNPRRTTNRKDQPSLRTSKGTGWVINLPVRSCSGI